MSESYLEKWLKDPKNRAAFEKSELELALDDAEIKIESQQSEIEALQAKLLEADKIIGILPKMNCECKNPNYPYDCGFPDCHPLSHEKCLEKLYALSELINKEGE